MGGKPRKKPSIPVLLDKARQLLIDAAALIQDNPGALGEKAFCLALNAETKATEAGDLLADVMDLTDAAPRCSACGAATEGDDE